MSKTLTQLSILISSPGDMEEERRIVRAAVDDVNRVARGAYGVVLAAMGSDVELFPGVGGDAQSVINEETAGRYDVYLGLLGVRFGTPTPRAGSGTEEEFGIALGRYVADPTSVRVLFYFKKHHDDVHRLDLEQLAKVVAFRKQLSEKVFFKEFPDSTVLLDFLKQDLLQLIESQWDASGGKWRAPKGAGQGQSGSSSGSPDRRGESAAEISNEALDEDDEEDPEGEGAPGILDVLVTSLDAFETATVALNNITKLTENLTSSLSARIESRPTHPDAREWKAWVDASASDLEDYAGGLKREVPIFKANSIEGLRKMEAVIDLFLSEKLGDKSELSRLPGQLDTVISQMKLGKAVTDQFRSTIDLAPGMTARFKRSKRTAKVLLADMSAAVTVFLDKALSIQAKVADALK